MPRLIKEKILWTSVYLLRNLVPFIEGRNGKIVLGFTGEDFFDYLEAERVYELMWYDFPEGDWHHENRKSKQHWCIEVVSFYSPKEALQKYLELAFGVEVKPTSYSFDFELDEGERYCLLEPAKQWLELHQWDLQYKCGGYQ